MGLLGCIYHYHASIFHSLSVSTYNGFQTDNPEVQYVLWKLSKGSYELINKLYLHDMKLCKNVEVKVKVKVF